jgi:hypothetical protein
VLKDVCSNQQFSVKKKEHVSQSGMGKTASELTTVLTGTKFRFAKRKKLAVLKQFFFFNAPLH